MRDNYTCVYCGKPGDTVDHITPKSLGGLTTYENCVTACHKCNNKKSNKTLDQLGWKKPVVKPVTQSPRLSQMLVKAQADPSMFQAWVEYISWFDPSVKSLTNK